LDILLDRDIGYFVVLFTVSPLALLFAVLLHIEHEKAGLLVIAAIFSFFWVLVLRSSVGG